MPTEVSLSSYLKRLRWSVGMVISIVTLIGLLKPSGNIGYPPLGRLSDFLIPTSFMTTCAAALIPWLCTNTNQTKNLTKISCVGLVLCGIVYSLLFFLFVVPVDIPTIGKRVYVTAGLTRTDTAQRLYGDLSDSEMLRQAGFDEPEVEELWIRSGRFAVLMSLFLMYLSVPVFTVVIFGSFARKDQLDGGIFNEQSSETKDSSSDQRNSS